MRDAISLKRAQYLHPAVKGEVIDGITTVEKDFPANVKVRITYTIRTFEEQRALYAQGRTKPGKIVTWAEPGESFHQYALAFDICIMINGMVSWAVDKYWLAVVKHFKKLGWTWGGDFKNKKDQPHFEKPHGFTHQQLLARYKAKQFIDGTEFVSLQK